MKNEGLKTKSWNFEEGRRRPKSPKESLKKTLSSIELSCSQLSFFAYFRRKLLERIWTRPVILGK